jgi:DNA invertase Pin-like site-specific DNA recombinase
MSKGQRVGYVRVSSVGQNTERQLDGVQVDRCFTDKASGKDTQRPQLEALLEFVREGDTVVVHSMDRLARNLDDLRKLVLTLTKRGIQVQFVKESLTFSGDDSPMAMLLLSMLGAVAEFERSLIKERQREGIAIAKTKGVYRGRKPSLNARQIEELRKRIAVGDKKAVIAREFGISRETLYQYARSGDQ